MTDEQSVWIVEESVDGGQWKPASDNYDDQQSAAIAADNAKVEDLFRRATIGLPIAGNSEFRAARYVRDEGSIATVTP